MRNPIFMPRKMHSFTFRIRRSIETRMFLVLSQRRDPPFPRRIKSRYEMNGPELAIRREENLLSRRLLPTVHGRYLRHRRPRKEARGAIASIKLVITSGEIAFSTQRVILASFRSIGPLPPTTKRNDRDGDFFNIVSRNDT